jgi:hypothetical protein
MESLSSVPLIDHHLLEDEGGGAESMCAGRTPIVESEIVVDGEFSPNHSNSISEGAAPSAVGFAHTETRLSLTACKMRALVIAVGVTKRRLRRFPRVIV